MSELVNNPEEQENKQVQEMRNPYDLPEETIAEAKEKSPMGDCVQPIGAWWNPDPAKQYAEKPIGCSRPPEGWTPPEKA